MNRSFLMFSFLSGTLVFSSCVTKKQYAQLQTDYNKLDKSYQDTKMKLVACGTKSKSLEERLAEAQKANEELKASYAALQGSLDKSIQQNSQGNVNISKLVDEINASNKFIKQLVEAKDKSDSLNMVLTNNLTRSLSREEMKDVDIQVLKGVVYISLADNMLYKSGSYEISERAGETLSKIAKIIMDYKEYEVLVLGTSTWGDGELQDDWYDGVKVLKSTDLSMKLVALFGCGDSESYCDTFCDGIGVLYEDLKDSGCTFLGNKVSTDGYSFSSSIAVVDDAFVGLPLDEVNESDKTAERIDAWTAEIKSKL